MKSYHNTNHLTGNDLAEAEKTCQTQEEKVLKVFASNPEKALSPEQVRQMAYLQNRPLTSIRRAITNLTEKGMLLKTNQMTIGMYGKPVHCWMLKTNQLQLFS